jgi:Fumarylacetoacetate (FAA) hydrolase family
MFHPVGEPMERGWVGRLDGDHVVQLAAQTLESFFTGGGAAREHAVYPLGAVRFLAPVLHPPSIRVFDDQTTFAFFNPAAIVGPDAEIPAHRGSVALLPRTAAVIGTEGRIAGLTGFADWRRGPASPPKDRDFAHGLGPLVVTPDELTGEPEIVVHVDGNERRGRRAGPAFEWASALSLAAEGTTLRPGDLIAAPWPMSVDPLPAPAEIEIEFEVIGTLRQLLR